MNVPLQSLCQVLDCKGGKGSNVAEAGAAAGAAAIGLHALRETGTINLRAGALLLAKREVREESGLRIHLLPELFAPTVLLSCSLKCHNIVRSLM